MINEVVTGSLPKALRFYRQLRSNPNFIESVAHLCMANFVQILAWDRFLSQKTPTPSTHSWLLIQTAAVGLMIAQVIVLGRSRILKFARWGVLVSAFSMLVAYFSYFYWSYGTPANFSTELTRSDAVYFTLGTLSTAGSGNIIAISDTSRGLQVLQMLLDMGLVLFAVGIAINRLSSIPIQKNSDSRQTPQQAGSRQAPKKVSSRQASKRSAKKQARKQARKQADGKREQGGGSKRPSISRPMPTRRVVHPSLQLIVAQTFVWYYGFFRETKGSSNASLHVTSLLLVIVAIAFVFIAARSRLHILALLTFIGNTFAVLLFTFASIYLSIGSKANFNMPLTHLDAVYFAVGTLSTAGTGNIAAISETARTTQAWQMVLGLALVLFAVGIAINRISSSSPEEPGDSARDTRRHRYPPENSGG